MDVVAAGREPSVEVRYDFEGLADPPRIIDILDESGQTIFAFEQVGRPRGSWTVPTGPLALPPGRTLVARAPGIAEIPLVTPSWPSRSPLVDDEKEKLRAEIESLIAQIVELLDRAGELREAYGWLPIGRLSLFFAAMMKIVKLLLAVPPRVREAAFLYLTCQNEKLAALTIEELKAAAGYLAAFAAMAAEVFEGTDRQALQQQLEQELEDIRNADATQTREQLVEALIAIKKANEAAVTMLAAFYSDQIAAWIKDTGEKAAAGFVVKQLVKLLIREMLTARYGAERAARSMPAVGLILLAVEAGIATAMLQGLSDIAEMVDRLLLAVIAGMSDLGVPWSDVPGSEEFTDTVNIPENEHRKGARVRLRAYLRCATRTDRDVEWTGECPLRFADGLVEIETTLDPAHLENGLWTFPYELKAESVTGSPCYRVRDPIACYIYMKITIRKGRWSETHNLVLNVRIF